MINLGKTITSLALNVKDLPMTALLHLGRTPAWEVSPTNGLQDLKVSGIETLSVVSRQLLSQAAFTWRLLDFAQLKSGLDGKFGVVPAKPGFCTPQTRLSPYISLLFSTGSAVFTNRGFGARDTSREFLDSFAHFLKPEPLATEVSDPTPFLKKT